VVQLLHVKSATVIEIVDRPATDTQRDRPAGVSPSARGDIDADRRQGEHESSDCQETTSSDEPEMRDRQDSLASGVNGGIMVREHAMSLREMVMQSCGMRVVLVNKRAFRAASSAELRQWFLNTVVLAPNGVLDASLRDLSDIDDDRSFMAEVRTLSQVSLIVALFVCVLMCVCVCVCVCVYECVCTCTWLKRY
jgi:hypothetical protein